MEEEHEARQHGEVLHAENSRHDAVGERHRAEPEEAHRGSEQVGRHRREWKREQQRDRDPARGVETGEQVGLREAAAELPREVGTEDIEQADERKGNRSIADGESLVYEERREVRADEHHLEAAGEVADPKEPEAPVAESLGERFLQRHARGGRVRAVVALVGYAEGGRHHHCHEQRQRDQRGIPAEARDQDERKGQQRELAEGARRARDAEHDAPLVGGIGAPQRAEDDIESRAAHADADKDADREREPERGARVRHEHETERVQQPPREEHAPCAEAVSEHSGKRLRDAPQQVLHRDGETEHLAPPAVVHAHRLQEQPEAVADAERERQNHARADEHDGGTGFAEIGHAGISARGKA